jgi:hypothetical protein
MAARNVVLKFARAIQECTWLASEKRTEPGAKAGLW